VTSAEDYPGQLAQMQPLYPRLAADLTAAGWQVVWATQNRQGDWTPLSGTTGGKSEFPAHRDMPPGPVRIAFRPPPGVKALDVDHYGEKLGWHTIERAEEALGVLPATWKVSARGAQDPSGRYLFRYDGPDFRDSALAAFADPDTGATCVEVVRTSHRFSWAPGDVNPKTMTVVQCYGPDGKPCPLPSVADLPLLPPEWHAYLADPPRVAVPQLLPVATEVPRWWEAIPDHVIGTREKLASLAFEMTLAGCQPEEVQGELRRVSVALDLSRPWGAADLAGLTDANTQGKVARIRGAWAEERAVIASVLPGGEERLEQAVADARREHERAVELAASPNRALALTQGLLPAAPGAGDIPEGAYATGAFRVEDVLKTVIAGDHEFEADGSDDQTLAEAILDRMQGARYCADSGQWVVWGAEKWAEMPGDLLAWVIAHLARNMPYGNPKPDEDDPEGPRLKRQSRNRSYLRSAAGAGAVARKAQALLMMPGQHPIAINRTDIDARPLVIWGGGRCWDIRASVHGLAEDRDAIGEPHLMTAACAPAEADVPGFRALCAAILPDVASREFWLDMMARGMLGYQTKRTIPLAVGGTGAGKTLLLERLPFGTYLVPVSGQDLLGGGDKEEARRLHVLVGRRLPYIDEGIGGGKYTMSRLKKITSGGTRLPARGIFGKEYEFEPVHTLLILVNPEEEPPYTDDAVASRICRVHFNGDKEAVKEVARFYEPGSPMWEAETPGVLAFFIRRAAQILHEKSDRGTSFAKPESVRAEQDGVAGEQDIVLDWLTKCTEPAAAEAAYTDAGTLYDHFLAWSARRRESIPGKISFGLKLTRHGVPVIRPGGRNLRGITVRQAWAGIVTQ
jgi:hypothetical protein